MRGSFIRRYNRFLVDIATGDGSMITAYCPATGRLKTCEKEGAEVEYLRVEKDDRKLDYDWWSIKMPDSWVIVDTRPANQWLYWHRTASWLPDNWHGATWSAEPTLPEGGRLDFRLEFPDRPDTWIEIKSVTWCDNGTGYFPDAPTKRGTRHLESLMELSRHGSETFLIFVSMREDIQEIRPAQEVDPDFTRALHDAKKAGVTLLGIGSRVDSRSLSLREKIPVKLP